MKNILPIFALFIVAKAASGDVITGNYTFDSTNNPYVGNQNNVYLYNGSSFDSYGFGLQFTAGNAGASKTWRLDSFEVELTASANKFKNVSASVFLYSWSNLGSVTVTQVTNGSQSGILGKNASNTSDLNVSEATKFRFGLTDFSQLSGPIVQSNNNYILGVNLSATLQDGETAAGSSSITVNSFLYDSGEPGKPLPWSGSSGWALPSLSSDLALAYPYITPSGTDLFSGSTNAVLLDTNAGAPVFSLGASAVPEPGTMALFSLALCCFGYFGYRHRCKRRQVTIALS